MMKHAVITLTPLHGRQVVVEILNLSDDLTYKAYPVKDLLIRQSDSKPTPAGGIAGEPTQLTN